MEIKDLAQIVSILKQNDVTEFELNQDGTQLKLVRGVASVNGAGGHIVSQPVTTVLASAQPAASANGAPAAPASHLVKVESPIVGTFYRRPSPDAELFAKEGDMIKKGDTLCIVEAMKLMNEIESTVSGKVEKVMVSDGQVVEFGEVLFLINPEA